MNAGRADVVPGDTARGDTAQGDPRRPVDVRVVMPGGVHDPAMPSGGNAYDLRVCRDLPGLGWRVQEHAVAGDWPRPGGPARAELARILADAADGEIVLLDGLIACAVPELVVPEAGRLRLAVLVHLPLGDETGLAPDIAAELDTREGETLRAVAAVVATGDWAARRLVDHHGLAPDRVHVAAPGADAAPPAAGTEGAPRLLCVAALTPRKGQHRLVEALATVTDLPWSCVCAGGPGQDPGYADRLGDLIEEATLGERVHLAGPLSGAALEASYAAADLLVLTSYAETYGMAVTEALARGIPVLATAVGGVPEAVGLTPGGDVPGALVPPDDPAALAAALRDWLTEPGVRDRWKAAAYERRDTLAGWDTTARNLAGVLAQLRPEPRGNA